MSVSEACNNNSNFLNAMMNIECASHCAIEPFTIYRAKLFKDGNQWCALYGNNLQEGVSGFGDSPAKAVRAFNIAWVENIKK